MKFPTFKTITLFALSVVASAALISAAPAPAESRSEAPVLKLLQSGKDPKRPLRLTAKVGLERSLVMTMKMDMEMSMGGNKMPAFKSPPMRFVMDMKVADVAPNGDIRYTFTYSKAEVVEDPQAASAAVEAMKGSLRGVEGLSGHVVVSNRGFTKEANVSIPPDANPQLKQLLDSIKQSMQQISSPLPEEPVGVGAKWETTMKLDQNGMVLKQSTSHELTELSGNTGKIALKIDQVADRQKMQPPGMPPGAQVELLALKSNGKGEMSIDLERLVPSLALMSINSSTRMMIEAGGQKNEMGMKLDLTMKMEGK